MLAVALSALAAVAAGCGGDDDPPGPFDYDVDAPLRADTGPPEREGAVAVRTVAYDGAGGDRVPGLLAVPRDRSVAGPCVVYQGGIGSRKEQAADVWQPLAGLGLATFTVDVRDQGARAADPGAFQRVLDDPDRVIGWLKGTVIDLRRAVDYLATRPECDPTRIGYVGLSQGAILGVLTAGADDRIRSSVLMSVGGDWDSALEGPGGLILPSQAEVPEQRAAALERLEPYSLRSWVGRIAPRPVLFVNGDEDPYVPLEDARRLHAAAGDPKEVFVYAGGHNPFESREALGAAAGFLRRTLVEVGG